MENQKSLAVVPHSVPFMGDELITVKQDDRIFVAMKPIVQGMGLAWWPQYRKIKAESDVYTITIMVMVGEDGKRRDMTCLDLDSLPFFFASVNPNKVDEKIRPKIIAYRKRCMQVLRDYWLRQSTLVDINAVTRKQLAHMILEAEAEKERLQIISEEQRTTIRKMKPLALHAKRITNCPGVITTSIVAKQLGTSAVTLNKFLHEKGVQFKRDGTWMLYAKYVGANLARIVTGTYVDSEGIRRTHNQLKWTEKGRMFVQNLWEKEQN